MTLTYYTSIWVPDWIKNLGENGGDADLYLPLNQVRTWDYTGYYVRLRDWGVHFIEWDRSSDCAFPAWNCNYVDSSGYSNWTYSQSIAAFLTTVGRPALIQGRGNLRFKSLINDPNIEGVSGSKNILQIDDASVQGSYDWIKQDCRGNVLTLSSNDGNISKNGIKFVLINGYGHVDDVGDSFHYDGWLRTTYSTAAVCAPHNRYFCIVCIKCPCSWGPDNYSIALVPYNNDHGKNIGLDEIRYDDGAIVSIDANGLHYTPGSAG